MKDQMDVCPLARGVMLRGAQPLSTPLQDGVRFFHPPLPARLSARLTARFPSRETYGVAMFRLSNNGWGRRALSTGSVVAHDKEGRSPCARYSALLAQAFQHLWLVFCDDVYRAFTWVRHTIHPSPVSVCGADRYIGPSRFRCQSVDCGSIVRRLCTSRYLPAHLRRIPLMGQRVVSRHHVDAQQLLRRLHVAAPLRTGRAVG